MVQPLRHRASKRVFVCLCLLCVHACYPSIKPQIQGKPSRKWETTVMMQASSTQGPMARRTHTAFKRCNAYTHVHTNKQTHTDTEWNVLHRLYYQAFVHACVHTHMGVKAQPGSGEDDWQGNVPECCGPLSRNEDGICHIRNITQQQTCQQHSYNKHMNLCDCSDQKLQHLLTHPNPLLQSKVVTWCCNHFQIIQKTQNPEER